MQFSGEVYGLKCIQRLSYFLLCIAYPALIVYTSALFFFSTSDRIVASHKLHSNEEILETIISRRRGRKELVSPRCKVILRERLSAFDLQQHSVDKAGFKALLLECLRECAKEAGDPPENVCLLGRELLRLLEKELRVTHVGSVDIQTTERWKELCDVRNQITAAAVAGVVFDTTADASNVTALMTNTDVTSIELGKATKRTVLALEESIPILAKERRSVCKTEDVARVRYPQLMATTFTSGELVLAIVIFHDDDVKQLKTYKLPVSTTTSPVWLMPVPHGNVKGIKFHYMEEAV